MSYRRRQMLGSSFPHPVTPSPIVQAWFTLYTKTLTSGAVFTGYTMRAMSATSVYDSGVPATATQVRVTIQSHLTLNGAAWDHIYLGHAAPSGDSYDFDGTQVQLLWSGSAAGSIAVGTTLTSDAVTYAFDKTKALIIAGHFTTPAALRADAFAGFSRAYKAAVDESATTDVTGYTVDTSNLSGFSKVEVYGVPPVPTWYTLYSRTITGFGSGWNGPTVRLVVPVAAYGGSVPATGTQLRVTIQSDAAGGAAFGSVYVGHAAASGDAYDFDGTQVQLLWGGSASGTVSLDSSRVSDAVAYAFDKTKPLVISVYIPSSSRLCDLAGATGFSKNFKAGNEAGTTDVTGYTTVADDLVGFPQVEVFG